MNWTRGHTLAAGLGLIALTNAVALLGAAWNRSGEEARLQLTQRELERPYGYGNRENSGIALRIDWRVPSEPYDQSPGRYYPYGRDAPWLDQAKMEALGFDVSQTADAERGRERYEKQLSREVLLVLELEGPAWRRMVELAGEDLAREQAKLAAIPGDKGQQTQTANARDALKREKEQASRLFVVDAGLDAAALRAKYPDKARYALARGEVRPMSLQRPERFAGYVSGLSVPSINVPREFRGVFPDAPPAYDPDPRQRAPFAATVAFGKRLEPWIVEATKK